MASEGRFVQRDVDGEEMWSYMGAKMCVLFRAIFSSIVCGVKVVSTCLA